MKKIIYFSLLILIVLGACSTKKNTRLSRVYHATNTRYNIYYNGKLAYDDALKSLETGYVENYVERLNIHAISAQPKDKSKTGGSFDRTILKSNKAIKLHSIKTKPAKKPGWRSNPKQVILQSKEEYNPFMKNCWLLMGQAEFYNADFLQASATFSYIARHYATEPEVVSAAKIWQARCYDEMNWLYESEDILNKLNQTGIPKKNRYMYELVSADYLIKDGKFTEAIPHLQLAIKGEPKALQRARMRYLLAQLYQGEGKNAEAYKSYGRVIRSNPPYTLEFAAHIRQTEVFPGGNSEKMARKLRSMARSDKNTEYLDQVYYALGNLYINKKDTVQAIKNYQEGIDKSKQNGMDKALCQIRLGDLYFGMRDYVKAQPCFSGAMQIIKKEYFDYKRVSKLSEVLDELVVQVQAVHLQDSLQVLAKMPEADRLAAIDKIIEKVKKEEKEAKEKAEKDAFLANQEAQGSGINRDTQTNTVKLPTTTTAKFYFYNPQTVADGKTQFQRKWGRRKNEDNWRRNKKQVSTFVDGGGNAGQQVAATDSTQLAETDSIMTPADSLKEAAASDPKSREYYLQQIPLTPEDIEASNVIIIDGLYKMALIYKDKLEDLPLSVDGFIRLDTRFPDNEHLLDSYYQIYLMALRLDDKALAAQYLQLLKSKFPESDYTIAVSDPNYVYNITHIDDAQDSLYQITYAKYLDSDTATVRKNLRTMQEKYPLATLMPKFMFLDALSYVQGGEVDSFKNALKRLVDKYPKADVSELAGEMLKGVLRGRALVQGDVRGMTWNMRFGVGQDGQAMAIDTALVFKPDSVGMNTPYKMLLIYPTNAVDKNQLLFAVAAYNFAHSMVKTFDMTFVENDPISMLEISGFYNLDEILRYYEMIHGKDGYADAISSAVTIVPISEENYETLMKGKTLDEYLTFFSDAFGERAPKIVARLKARMEADTNVDKSKDEEPPLPENIEEEPIEEEAPAEETNPDQPKRSVRRREANPSEEQTPATTEKAKTEKQKEAEAAPATDKADKNISKEQNAKTTQPTTTKKPPLKPIVPNAALDSAKRASKELEAIETPHIFDKIPVELNAVDDTVRMPLRKAIEAPKENEGLSLKQVLEIRKQQRETKAEKRAAEKKAKEEQQQKAKEERLKRAEEAKAQRQENNVEAEPANKVEEAPQEEDNARQQQQQEEKTILEQKAEREKMLENDRKKALEQAADDRKAKLKAQKELRKQKEKEAKELRNQKEKAQKEKAAAYEKKRKEKLKQREAELKQKEESQKTKAKAARKR